MVFCKSILKKPSHVLRPWEGFLLKLICYDIRPRFQIGVTSCPELFSRVVLGEYIAIFLIDLRKSYAYRHFSFIAIAKRSDKGHLHHFI